MQVNDEPREAERPTYFLDGFRVELRVREGWHCECDEFALLGQCEHTTQATTLAAIAVPATPS